MDISALMKQVKKGEFLFSFFDVLFLALSGIGVIFFFERQIFLSVDSVKLMLLSGAITTPLVFFNAILVPALYNVDLKKGNELFLAITIGAMSTSMLLNGLLIYVYWMGYTLKTYTIVTFCTEAVLAIGAFILEKRNEKNKAKKKEVGRKV